MAHDLLRLDDVSISYGALRAVRCVSAEFTCCSFVGILGPNGGGKSTLLKAILGELPIDSGSITLADRTIAEQMPRIAYLPQRHGVDLDFPLTVRQVVEQGRLRLRGLWRRFSADDVAAVDAALAELGLTDLAERPLADLSGGQQQRAFLARVAASGADVVLLDEPLTGLDPAAQADLVRDLQRWARDGKLVIAVLHDVALAKACCSHALLVATDLVAAGPVDDVLTESHVRRAYGAAALTLRGLDGQLDRAARSSLLHPGIQRGPAPGVLPRFSLGRIRRIR